MATPKLFCWRTSTAVALPNASTAHRARFDTMTPVEMAADLIPKLQAEPEGARALLLWHCGHSALNGSVWSNTIEAFETNGDTVRTWVGVFRLFRLLRDADALPDNVSLDYESFNEAALFQARKEHCLRLPHRGVPASMRPRFFKRGKWK